MNMVRLKSGIRSQKAELRRSNNGKYQLPALLTAKTEGEPLNMSAVFSFDKGSVKEEKISAGFLMGYTNESSYYWAGARLEKSKQYWIIGKTVNGRSVF